MQPRSINPKRVYDVAIVSPLERANRLSHGLDSNIYLKREDAQIVHSFKLRGAYLKIAHLTAAEQKQGIIAASAGNHAQGVALAAQRLGLPALIVMPQTAPQIKIDAVRNLGAQIELHGESFSDAAIYCHMRAKQTGRAFIHPFDDPVVIAGQGTVGTEILEQLPSVTHIFVPVGGGGLLAGIAQTVKSVKPSVKIIGVEPSGSNCMQQALQAGERVSLQTVDIFADGVAVKQAGTHTFRLTSQYVDSIITVTNEQICHAIKAIYDETRHIAEPAGALAVAGVQTYRQKHDITTAHIAAICSGANMEFSRLRYVIEQVVPSVDAMVS